MPDRTKEIAFTGIFIALIVGMGYALALVPNIELVTSLIFLAGILMGPAKGILIGTLSELLFSVLNPMGSGLLFPPMLLMQSLAMALVGATGGFCRKYMLNWKNDWIHFAFIGACGLILTVFYDILVSLAFPLAAGFSFREVVGVVITGFIFSLVHIAVNTIIFMMFIPYASRQLFKAIPYFTDRT
jgi:uncharacterized membrane protein